MVHELMCLTGEFSRIPAENEWHVGRIKLVTAESDAENESAKHTSTELHWENNAGKSWELIPDLERGVLITSTDNPYHTSTPEFIIGSRNSDGLLTSFVFGNDIFVSRSAASDEEQVVLGEYRRCPIDNDWHIGHIVQVPPGPEGSNGARLQWINRAGVSWDLFLDADKGVLKTGDGNPYHESYSEFRLRKRDGEIIGFMFGGDFFVSANHKAVQQMSSGGLKGYISMRLPRNEDGDESYRPGFGYGTSFYVGIWPLIEQPIASFQIGLPSTWIVPDNTDFFNACVDDSTKAWHWKERAPYYRNVFQTIEGGLGYWCSTQFGSTTPKYRINGTSNGYNHEVSSSGFGFGNVKPLVGDEIGIAQLSNRLLVPPDGFTFDSKGTQVDGLLGNAWMALPLTPRRVSADGTSTGDHCWTLFLRAENFHGAVAFWIPELWTVLSRTYRTIDGRGLDARPGNMGGGAMEVNTVPYFASNDPETKQTYTRVPKLNFPVNRDGITVLMRDVTFYSQKVLYDGMKDVIGKGCVSSLPRVALTEAKRTDATIPKTPRASEKNDGTCEEPPLAWVPEVISRPWQLRQGPGDRNEGPFIRGIDKVVEPLVLTEQGSDGTPSHIFALKWNQDAQTSGSTVDGSPLMRSFPEYFVHNEEGVLATDEVPEGTGLHSEKFAEHYLDNTYELNVPESDLSESTEKSLGPFSVILSDGSELEYLWYRFIDQPALRHLDWSAEDRANLQDVVEKIHTEWTPDASYIPEPASGSAGIVALDAAQIVSPPQGYELGYVPVVLRQGTPRGRYPSQQMSPGGTAEADSVVVVANVTTASGPDDDVIASEPEPTTITDLAAALTLPRTNSYRAAFEATK